MKRNTMRILSLVLTLVMLLGAVPFAAAGDPPAPVVNPADGAEIEVTPKTAVWPGEKIELVLDPTTVSGYTIDGIKWYVGETLVGQGVALSNYELNGNVTMVAKYTATPASGDAPTPVEGKSEVELRVKKSSEPTIAIKNLPETTYVGAKVPLEVIGANQSDIEWIAEAGDASTDKDKASFDGNNFVASAAGTYKIIAEATNNPADDEEDQNDNVRSSAKTIKVEASSYEVTLEEKTIPINNKTTKLTVTAKKNGVKETPKSMDFTVADETILIVNDADGTVTPIKPGSTKVKVNVTFEDNTSKESNEVYVTVTDSGLVFMEGKANNALTTDDDEIELDFSVSGPASTEEVNWFFTVEPTHSSSSANKKAYFEWADSDESDKYEYEEKKDGSELKNVELTAKKGIGIAKITAKAWWGSGSKSNPNATGTFYVSFYDEVDYTVTLKKDVEDFDWDDKDVFAYYYDGTTKYDAITTTGTNKTNAETKLKTLSLKDKLHLEEGEFIDLTEDDVDDNEDVGTITGDIYDNKDYDADKTNKIKMEDLDELNFEVEDEGTFVLEYKQYDIVGGYEMVIGEGEIEIIVGEGTGDGKKGDIDYEVKNKGEVELDEDDFEEFFEEYCDDEDITGNDAEFGYVIFDDFDASDINGALRVEDDDKNLRGDYKLHFKYDDEVDSGSKDYDLDDVLYKASSTKTDYMDEVDFVCYSDGNKEICKGTLTFTVGAGEKEVSDMAFIDVPSGEWYYDAIKYVYEQGIMEGTSDTKFSPDTNLTRGMIVLMLYRIEGNPSVTATNKFSDVKIGDWYYDAVRWAAKNGIVTGTSATTFSPNTNITRQDLATILYRYVKEYKGEKVSLGTLAGFADASQVSDYASSAMKWAVGTGIVKGEGGSLLPKGNATRAQAATMFQRLLAE